MGPGGWHHHLLLPSRIGLAKPPPLGQYNPSPSCSKIICAITPPPPPPPHKKNHREPPAMRCVLVFWKVCLRNAYFRMVAESSSIEVSLMNEWLRTGYRYWDQLTMVETCRMNPVPLVVQTRCKFNKIKNKPFCTGKNCYQKMQEILVNRHCKNPAERGESPGADRG